jgi:hypothetical protein
MTGRVSYDRAGQTWRTLRGPGAVSENIFCYTSRRWVMGVLHVKHPAAGAPAPCGRNPPTCFGAHHGQGAPQFTPNNHCGTHVVEQLSGRLGSGSGVISAGLEDLFQIQVCGTAELQPRPPAWPRGPYSHPSLGELGDTPASCLDRV